MIVGQLMFLALGPVVTLFFIALPAVAAGVGLWLVWTGLEGKPWWVVRLAAGAPVLAYGAFGIVYMTL